MAWPNLFRSGAFVPMAPPASNTNQHNHRRSTAFVPMPPPSTLKRQAPTPPEDSPPAKRTQSRLGFDNSMNLIRRTASDVKIPLEQDIAAAAEDEEEEDFVDAPEEQDELADGATASAETANIDGEHETPEGMGAAQSGNEDEDEDLFASTFGGKATRARQAEDEDEDEDEDDDSRGVGTKLRTFAKAKDNQAAAADYTFIKTEHADTCNGDRGASTPPAFPGTKLESSQSAFVANKAGGYTRRSTATPAPLPEIKEADLVRDKSRALRSHEKFHHKAKQLQPRLPLPPHRYWIGVLHTDRKPQNAKEEKHFTWMKGNRVTTVETIWHTYQMTTMTDGFVLLLGGVERVDFQDRCEQLNHFNDNFICFRAVEASDPASKGHEIGAGCPPPEVIAIDD